MSEARRDPYLVLLSKLKRKGITVESMTDEQAKLLLVLHQAYLSRWRRGKA